VNVDGGNRWMCRICEIVIKTAVQAFQHELDHGVEMIVLRDNVKGGLGKLEQCERLLTELTREKVQLML
jgi:hypothetical protein